MGPQEAITTATDPATVMERVLAEVLLLIPAAEGAAVLLCAQRDFLVYAAAGGNLAGSTGTVVSFTNSLSGLSIRSGVTQHCHDATSARG